MEPKYQVGDNVKVQLRFPPGHIRTPEYIRGKEGVVSRYFGNFRNPEQLAYGKDGLPLHPLYWISFSVNDVWAHQPAEKQDKLLIEISEHWLDPA